MGVHAEEATFTFSGIDWKTPFQRPFFKVIEDRGASIEWAAFSGSGEEDQMARSSA